MSYPHTHQSRKILLLLLMTVLAGCGGSAGNGSTPDPDATPNLAVVPPTAPITPPGPANAVANAGTDLDVARNSTVSLDGSSSSDPDGDALTYKWSQVFGPDVTRGIGYLNGINPRFTAPQTVSTLLFKLSVSDGNGFSPADTIQINVLEHLGDSFYVDGDNGSDTSGDGSRALPFASLSKAISSIPAPDHDIYVRTRTGAAAYDESAATLDIPDSTSLYGGYGANWVRDVAGNRSPLTGHFIAVRFNRVDNIAWFSGFDLSAIRELAPANPETSALSVIAGTATLYIEDNSISVGQGSGDANHNYYGLRLTGIDAIRVSGNTIMVGNAGDGSDGSAGVAGRSGGSASAATDHNGSAGALSALTFPDLPDFPLAILNHGGDGGAGGNLNFGDGTAGLPGRQPDDGVTAAGASGGSGGSSSSGITVGGDGDGGQNGFNGTVYGQGGNAGDGGSGYGNIVAGYFVNTSSSDGQDGEHGVGAGGGGGGIGGADIIGIPGGGGGGGGAGGIAGLGGKSGSSGYASIGILVDGIADAVIESNLIRSGNGGDGGDGGAGGIGGQGGDGAAGRAQDGDGAAGGHGGGGGQAGEGGQGGAGAGGPSFSIMIGANIAPIIKNNQLYTGNGGEPGADGSGLLGAARGGRYGQHGADGSVGGAGGDGYLGDTRALDGIAAEGGWIYGIYDVDPLDGMVAAVSGNRITRGFAGTRGTSGFHNF